MLFYLTLFALFLFSAVISAVAGLLVYFAGGSFISSAAAPHILGVGAAMLAGWLMTKLLLFEIWYYYAAVLAGAVIIYFVLANSSVNDRRK